MKKQQARTYMIVQKQFLGGNFINKLWISNLLEKAMAPHSSTLAWKIPWMEEPDVLPSMGSHRVEHDWSDLAAAAASNV